MTDSPTQIKKSPKEIASALSSQDAVVNDAKKRISDLMEKSKTKQGKSPFKNVKIFNNPKEKKKKRGVVYLGHLPHGFYEEELRGFFSQFGRVLRVKVSRSPKTGKSKGYAFVEFAYNDVAKIVADTMNNYLMFEKLLKAQYIPPEKVHPLMFPSRWITPVNYPTLVRRKRLKVKQDAPITEADKKKHRTRIHFKIKRSVIALQALGIVYQPHIYDPDANNSVKNVKASNDGNKTTE